MRASRKRSQEGFTLIEVMVALFVFIIALLGLVALQKATISATNRGRDHTAAVNIASYVMSQIKNEAASLALSQDDLSLVGTDHPYLNNALATGGWTLMPESTGSATGGDFRFDHYLMPSTHNAHDGVDDAPFCVAYRIDRFTPVGTVTPGQFVDGLYQARVRVSWPRWGQYAAAGETSGDAWNDCASRLDDSPADSSDWERVELTSIVSREYTSRW